MTILDCSRFEVRYRELAFDAESWRNQISSSLVEARAEVSRLEKRLEDRAAEIGHATLCSRHRVLPFMWEHTVAEFCYPAQTNRQARKEPVPVFDATGIVKFSDHSTYSSGVLLARHKDGHISARRIDEPFSTVTGAKDFLVLQGKGGMSQALLSAILINQGQPLFLSYERGHALQFPAIGSKKLRIAPIITWKLISEFLADYDDLIRAISNKMKLLDELAQSVYWLWFVECRPGGIAKLERIGSVLGQLPVGWSIKSLGTVTSRIAGIDRDPKKISKDADYPVYAFHGVRGWIEKPVFEGPGLIFGKRGGTGAFYWEPFSYSADGSCEVLESELPKEFLYLYLKGVDLFLSKKDHFVGKVNQKTFDQAPIMVPSEDALRSFEEAVAPTFLEIRQLHDQERKLVRKRDKYAQFLLTGAFWSYPLYEIMRVSE